MEIIAIHFKMGGISPMMDLKYSLLTANSKNKVIICIQMTDSILEVIMAKIVI